ncbi:MAG: DNA-directed RNA polymerase subunit K [Candidatus Aenigmatarchaeota archaeon]
MQPKEQYSRYEKTRIISARALQIAQGGPVLTKIPKSMMDPIEIATLEWEAGVIPIDIKIKKELPVASEEADVDKDAPKPVEDVGSQKGTEEE